MAFSRKEYSSWVLLGEGGEARVYRARQTSLGRLVAIREVKPVAANRSEREAELLASLRHQGLAVLIDYGYASGKFHLVQDYIRGSSLDDLGILPPLICIRLVRFLARTLHFLHGKGIVHGDLNPGNLLVTSNEECVLVDFGMVRRVGEVSTEVLGAPRYLAPEHFLGEALTPETDIFCLGLLLYRMLTGKDIFDQNQFESIRDNVLGLQKTEGLVAIQHKYLELDPELVAVLNGCVQYDTKARFEDMDELAENLDIAEQKLRNRLTVEQSQNILRTSDELIQRAIDGRERVALENTCDQVMAKRDWNLALELLRELLALTPQDETVHRRLRFITRSLRLRELGKRILIVAGLLFLVAFGAFLGWMIREPASSMDQLGKSLLIESRIVDDSTPFEAVASQMRVVEIPELEKYEEIRIDSIPQQTGDGIIRLAPGAHRFAGRLLGTQEWVYRKVTVPLQGPVVWTNKH